MYSLCQNMQQDIFDNIIYWNIFFYWTINVLWEDIRIALANELRLFSGRLVENDGSFVPEWRNMVHGQT